jgi:hypothetical protein
LVITQSRENHHQISSLLEKLHDRADDRIEAWMSEHKSSTDASSAAPAR